MPAGAVATPPAPNPKPAVIPTVKNDDGATRFWGDLWNNTKYYAQKAASGVNKGVEGVERMAAGVVAQPAYLSGNTTAMDFADSLYKAIDAAWEPSVRALSARTQAAENPANPNGVNSTAQAVGATAEGIAPLALGPEGMLASSTMNSGSDAILNNQDLKTVYKLAGVALVANAAGMALPLNSPKLITRLAWGLGGNAVITPAQAAATKYVLKSDGYKAAADKIDPTDPSSFASGEILGAVMAAIGGPHAETLRKKGFDVPPPGAPGTEPPPPPPGPSPETVKNAAPPTGGAAPAPDLSKVQPAPAAATSIPDQPTAEPAKDIRAQFRDMNDPKTPRVGVFLSTDNLNNSMGGLTADHVSVASSLSNATKQGRTVAMDNGTLVLKTKAGAEAVQKRLDAGEDPQAVIGSVTGAGPGKAADQTAVVQGHTPDGAVATETTVKPSEVPQAAQKAIDQGKTPVVTTPEAALARRESEIAKEQQPGAGAEPAPEPLAKSEPAPAPPAAPEPTMGIFKSDSGKELPVHIEEGAPTGKVRVRPIDASGEAADHTIDVPEDRVRTGTEYPPEPAKPEPESTEATQERRVNTAQRQKISEMSPEQMRKTLLTNEVSGIQNRRAYEESDKLPVQAHVDLDNFKYLNDTKGHEAGDEAIRTAAQILHEETGGNAYHISGDEFKVQGTDKAKVATQLARARERLTAKGIEFSRGLGKDTTEAEKALQADKAQRKAEGKRGERGKAPKAAGATGALAEALAAHEAQEKIPDGQTRAASLGERQDNASAFASVLKTAAQAAHGTVDDAIVARATKAAAAAERLTYKSAEDTAKGRGTGHAKVTALVAEMHKAARGILGVARRGDEITVGAKAAELKEKIAAKRTRYQEIAAKTEKTKAGPLIEVPVNEKYADQIKPKDLTEQQQTRMLGLKTRFVNEEDPAKASRLRDQFEQTLHDLNRPKREIDQILKFLDDERAGNKPEKPTGRISDTLEEEEHTFEQPETGFSKGYRPTLGGKLEAIKQRALDTRLNYEWDRMAKSMESAGYLNYMRMHTDSGAPISAHALLNKMIEHAQTPHLQDILTSIRQRLPDTPIYSMSEVKNLFTGRGFGEKAGGLFTNRNRTIQVNLENTLKGPTGFTYTVQALVHEMIHAGTTHELESNPGGAAAKRMDQLHDALIKRLESKYGADVLEEHQAYFKDRTGTVPKPEGFMRHLYGITNSHEMAAEVLTHPEFAQEIADSEAFALPGENLGSVKESLLTKVFKAIGSIFGMKDPNLLQHIVGAVQDAMESQRRNNPIFDRTNAIGVHNALPEVARAALGEATTVTPLEAARAAPGLRALRDPAPEMSDTDEFRFKQIFPDDDEPAAAARAFSHVVGGKSVDALRRVITNLKTVGQIFRDHMTDFGGDKEGNPLRELQEADIKKNVLINRMGQISKPVAEAWTKLKSDDERKMSQLMVDATMYRMYMRKGMDDQPAIAKGRDGFETRYNQYKARYNALSPEARDVYNRAADANRAQMREMRKAAIDTAIDALGLDLDPAQKGLLYGAKHPEVYDSIIGDGKSIDVGEDNAKLKAAVSDFAGMSEIEGDYFHLGRQGEYVVAARPEGTREFNDVGKANEWAQRARELSPDSTAEVSERGGKHVVDYKVKYVSMHETRADAEAEQARLVAAGFEPGLVTQKTMGRESAPLSYGLKELVSEAERKIQKNGADAGTEALVASLRSAFLQMTAARSAYAGSRLARKSVGGVKAQDMRQNFAQHASSTMWHAAQMRTVFEQARAMARVRAMARDSRDNVSQRAMYRRGQVVEALNKHAIDEVQNYGHKAPLNSMLAKLGFMGYLASPSHAAIWMTQNFTTGIPVAGARYGYGKSLVAFGSGMRVIGPALRATVRNVFAKGGTSSDIHNAIIAYVAKHPTLGKWASGDNSPLRQLIDRGVIDHGYANELGSIARGDNATTDRVFEWARLVPAMADAFNRVSTALAGLQLTNGDVRKTADFVQEVHADYSQQNKPLAFKKVNRIPGMNSLTMFTTYAQEMTHLVYSNLVASFRGENKAVAAKTLAGVVMGNALFAGVYGGAALAPLQLAMYAYHKIADQEGEVWDFKNAVHMWLVDHLGKTAGNTAAYGLPHLIGADVSSRMGLADLFFHNPPDLLSADKDMWKNAIFEASGPMPQMLANNVSSFVGHMQKGEPFQAISSVIPVKMYQDAVKAFGLMTAGKVDSLGAQQTAPSTGDAITQALGFKPASVAEAQEKIQVRVENAAAQKAARTAIIRAYVSAPDAASRVRAEERLNSYIQRFPARSAGIASEIQAMTRDKQLDEQGATNDADTARATDF
jgi:GGDEF domain-containing protein